MEAYGEDCAHVMRGLHRVAEVRHGCGTPRELHGERHAQSEDGRRRGRPHVQPQRLQNQKRGQSDRDVLLKKKRRVCVRVRLKLAQMKCAYIFVINTLADSMDMTNLFPKRYVCDRKNDTYFFTFTFIITMMGRKSTGE